MLSVLTKNQKITIPSKRYTENGTVYKITPTVRYDDDCGNGHNSFSITGSIKELNGTKMIFVLVVGNLLLMIILP